MARRIRRWEWKSKQRIHSEKNCRNIRSQANTRLLNEKLFSFFIQKRITYLHQSLLI